MKSPLRPNSYITSNNPQYEAAQSGLRFSLNSQVTNSTYATQSTRASTVAPVAHHNLGKSDIQLEGMTANDTIGAYNQTKVGKMCKDKLKVSPMEESAARGLNNQAFAEQGDFMRTKWRKRRRQQQINKYKRVCTYAAIGIVLVLLGVVVSQEVVQGNEEKALNNTIAPTPAQKELDFTDSPTKTRFPTESPTRFLTESPTRFPTAGNDENAQVLEVNNALESLCGISDSMSFTSCSVSTRVFSCEDGQVFIRDCFKNRNCNCGLGKFVRGPADLDGNGDVAGSHCNNNDNVNFCNNEFEVFQNTIFNNVAADEFLARCLNSEGLECFNLDNSESISCENNLFKLESSSCETLGIQN